MGVNFEKAQPIVSLAWFFCVFTQAASAQPQAFDQ